LTLTISGSIDLAQLEVGSTASSPIETFGSTVTRAGDVPTLNTSLFPISPTSAHTVAVKFSTDAGVPSANQYVFALSDGSLNNRSAIFKQTSGAWGQRVASGGVLTVSAASGSVGVGGLMAVRIAPNDYALFANGSLVLADGSVTMPATYTTLSIGVAEAGGTNQTDGYIESVLVVPRGVSNAEMATFGA
jgi:hypothetical protein